MSKVSTAIVGAAGEHYVLSQLLRRGWVATLAPAGAPNMDILVTDTASNRLCSIQVKTRRGGVRRGDGGWAMAAKHETLYAPDLFYVCVDLGKAPSDHRTVCYIIPSEVVADAIRINHEAWLATPGPRGRTRNSGSSNRRLLPDYIANVKPVADDIRAIVEPYGLGWLDRYRDNWDVLGLPSAESF